jgi:hypothetical protein
MLIAAFVAGQHSSTVVAAQSHSKWEYKIVPQTLVHPKTNLTNEINQLGEDGWEAVSMNSTSVLMRRSK